MTIRTRLTLLYAGAFFLASGIVVAALYVYFGHLLDHQLGTRLASHDLTLELIRQDHDSTRRAVLVAAIIALAAVGIAAAGLGWWLAGKALKPLQRITATAKRVAQSNLDERIGLQGPPDEIKNLADTFDAMLERLEDAFDSQRRFVAYASHELRTPLTINRALVEVALEDPDACPAMQQVGANLLQVNARQQRLIDGLLTLASSEEHLSTRHSVDLADIARQTIAELTPAAERAGVDIGLALDPAPVAGDPVLLERLAHNLIDNAVRYNVEQSGWVRVSTGRSGDQALLVVENSGPAIAPGEVDRLFEPFHRLAADYASGAGLGLSIVRAVARAHGGEAHATPGRAGGLTVTVHLSSTAD